MEQSTFLAYTALILGYIIAFTLAGSLAGGKSAVGVDPARMGCLDGIRGYLALGVMAHHFLINWVYTRTSEWKPPGFEFFANLGPVAVSMFL